jgi:RNA ligase
MSGPTHLRDLFEIELLDSMLEQRYVRVREHPGCDLRILNYTARAQYDKTWNDVTLTCRGLIIDRDGFVVARPFRKFFNAAERASDVLSGPVRVTEKLDGSLGVLYPLEDGWSIATRGSFDSAQAQIANEIWRERHVQFEPNPLWTYLFEVIYPENRIVIDYGTQRQLVLLGAVDIATGASITLEDAASGWSGAVVETLPHRSFQAALEAPARADSEGMVVHFTDTDVRVKLKHDEYVRLHRLVTGVSERRVWEIVSVGDELGDWLENVPDELYHFVTTTRDGMLDAHAVLKTHVEALHAAMTATLPAGHTRRELAEYVHALEAEEPLARLLYSLQDGKSIDGVLWAQLRPLDHVPYFQAEG